MLPPASPDDPDQRAILDLIARRGSFVLAGNKEHYAIIRRLPGSWLRIDGDPMAGGADETQHPISDAEVLHAVRQRVRDRMEFYGRDDGRPTWAEVLAWLHEGWQ